LLSINQTKSSNQEVLQSFKLENPMWRKALDHD
jgi:hypothetical protein